MKRKSAVKVLLIVFIISACTSAVKVTPTETLVFPTTPTTTTITPTTTPSSENKILDIALSADGNKLAIYANSGVYIYDTETLSKTVFQEFRNLYYDKYSKYKGVEPSGAIAFSSDGNTLAISGRFPDTAVQLWDFRTAQYLVDIYDIPPAYRVPARFIPAFLNILFNTTKRLPAIEIY